MGNYNVFLFDATMILFGVASLLYIVALYGRNEGAGKLGTLACWVAAAISTVALGVRWWESYQMGFGRIPVTNMYESLVFFGWSIVWVHLYTEKKFGSRSFGAFVMPLAFATMLFAHTREAAITPLNPALQSYWLHAHVITCFIGYAAFAVSAGVAVMYLVKAPHEAAGGAAGGVVALFPSTKVLDELVYKAIIWGFPLLTAGIITGAAWANYAWGTYWSWDPKETWSLIIWLVYAAFLHARITRGWHGKRAAVLSIVGFLATIFCYLGVNLFLSGLHSYGSG